MSFFFLVEKKKNLSNVVNKIPHRPHRRDHRRQPCRFREVGDDFPPFDPRVVVLIDQQRLHDDEHLVDVGPHQLVQLAQDAVDNLDQDVALLVVKRRGHQQRQDLIEQRAGTKLARLVP